MPLYESFKPTFSVKTREFAGSLADDLAAAKKQLNEQYLMGLDLQEKTQSSMADAANLIHEEDRNNWNSINSEVNSRLQTIAERGDYENAILELYTLSNRAAQKMKPLLMQKKAYDEHVAKLEDPKLNLPQTVKEMKLAEANAQFKGGTKFNPDGTIQNPFRGTQPVQHLDNIEEAQKALKVVTGNSDNRILSFDELGQTYKIQTESGIVEVDKVEVENAIKQGMYMNPSWQQSIDQDARGRSFSNIKNLTEEGAVEWASRASGPKAEQVRQLIASGMPAKEAIQTVEYKETKENIEKSILDYAGNAAYRNTRSSFSASPSTDEQRRYQEEQAAKAAKATQDKDPQFTDNIIGVYNTSGVESWAKLGKDLTDKEASVETSLADLQTQLQMAEKQRDGAGNNVDVKLEAEAKINSLKNAIQVQQAQQNSIKNTYEMLAQRKAAELYPNPKDNPFLNGAERQAKWNAFQNLTGRKNTFTTAEGSITKEDLFRAFTDTKTYQILTPPKRVEGYSRTEGIKPPTPTYSGKIKVEWPLNSGKFYTIEGKDAYDLYQISRGYQSKKAQRVHEETKKSAVSGTSMRTTAIPITTEEEVKALITLATTGNRTLSDGLTPVNNDYFDFSKATNVAYIPELDKIALTVPNDEGVSVQILVDAQENSFKGILGGRLASDPNPTVRSIGRASMSGRMKKYVDAFNQSGQLLTKVPGTSSPIQYVRNGVPTQIYLKRTGDGKYIMVDPSSNKILEVEKGVTSMEFADAVELLEISLDTQNIMR